MNHWNEVAWHAPRLEKNVQADIIEGRAGNRGERMSEYIYATNGEPMANVDREISLARDEIVRCRDCKHFTPRGTFKFANGKENADFCDYVRGWRLQITPDGFCAWGVRKEGGDD